MSHVIIGTAGHIDHGKTALVRALTGIDTDTLPEEQARGVTIDIGFAYWKENVTLIDVPGHERFVKNMVTGVCTVDIALLVVAADDGVMPQTREHLGILNLLGVRKGLVALTKTDLADPEWVALVAEDLRDLLQGTFLAEAPIVPVSSISGEGIPELRGLLEAEVEQVTERADRGVFRLPVDRVFSSQGFGTIVTGTVLSGAVHPRDTVTLLPADRQVRVRGVQTHGRDVESAGVGARAALNLADVEVADLHRGDILAQPGYFNATYMIDARLDMLPDAPVAMENRTRVHLHLGPREVLARVILLEAEELNPGESQLVQFRLESPGVAARGDRFVVRRYSPVQTVGGGIVLDTQPPKHRRHRPEVLASIWPLEADDPVLAALARLSSAGGAGRTAAEMARDLGVDAGSARSALEELVSDGRAARGGTGDGAWFVEQASWDGLLASIEEVLGAFHRENPLRPGILREALRPQVPGRPDKAPFERALTHLEEAGRLGRRGAYLALADHRIELSEGQEGIRKRIDEMLANGSAEPPDLADLCERIGGEASSVRDVVDAMQAMEQVVRLEENLIFHPAAVEQIREALVAYLKENGSIGVSAFRDLAGTTRKYAVPLLNHFDASGVTVRDGDVRVLSKSHG
jgi:selenocysteine-specific elongation factor